ncbi:hypothetical protein CSUI_010298 [Cystoisospora suis]|uniref:Uncharacterized protein n=1 Tax=Cystoisospora suis TaxID=483139 RepID=A0A2C6JYQ5_9APIC|nr:hypothetical protein CSUI_010298 [Cystoisospora suis]
MGCMKEARCVMIAVVSRAERSPAFLYRPLYKLFSAGTRLLWNERERDRERKGERQRYKGQRKLCDLWHEEKRGWMMIDLLKKNFEEDRGQKTK